MHRRMPKALQQRGEVYARLTVDSGLGPAYSVTGDEAVAFIAPHYAGVGGYRDGEYQGAGRAKLS